MVSVKKHLHSLTVLIKSLPSQPVYPILFALYPILFIYGHNIEELTIDVIYIPILVVVISVSLLFILARLVYKTWPKAAACLGLFVIVFALYGAFTRPLPDEITRLGNIIIGPDKMVFPLVSAVLISAFWLWWKSAYSGNRWVAIGNLVSVVLVGMASWQILAIEVGRYNSPTSISAANNQQKQSESASGQVGQVLANKPDVYYLIFDRYTSNEVLEDSFGYDNSEFYEWLVDQGFFVAENGMANYLKTSYSISSTLNLEYHNPDSWPSQHPTESTVITPLLKENATTRIFEELGYNQYSLSSWYWNTAQEGVQDKVFQYTPMFWLKDPYIRELVSSSMAMPIVSLFSNDNTADSIIAHKVYTQYQLSSYEAVFDMPSPKFVMAHVLLPHSPYIFDKDCNFDRSIMDRMSHDQGYIEHIKCATKAAKEMITYIKQKSNDQAIIVLLADEGASSEKYAESGKHNNFASVSDQALRERASVLSAYYFPDKDYSQLNDSMSSVNAFRVVFDQYFNIPLDPLEAKIFGFNEKEELTDLSEVSDRLIKSDSR